MVLVHFKGFGEWFIKNGSTIRLAITRTTDQPYYDPPKQIEFCEDYKDWLGFEEDNNENFSEWVRLTEQAKNNFQESSKVDFIEDYEYHIGLGGIFARDFGVSNAIYTTDNLRCFGADYIDCKVVSGVFKLDKIDEEAYLLTGQWEAIKKQVKRLLPCKHPASAFLLKVHEGRLISDLAEHYFFEIKDKKYSCFNGKPKLIDKENFLELLIEDNAAFKSVTESPISPLTYQLKSESNEHDKDSSEFRAKKITYLNTISALLAFIDGTLPIEENETLRGRDKIKALYGF